MTCPGPLPYPLPPQNRGTNGFAIAALVLGILPGIVLGMVFGIVALVQTRTSGESGRGLAIAGIVLSGLWTVAGIAGIVVAIATQADRNGDGQIVAGGSVPATALQAGDCINGLEESSNLLSLPAVPCRSPHQGEVFAVFDLPSGAYPGETAVATRSESECGSRLGSYSPGAVTDPSVGIFMVYPRAVNWRAGDREVVCIANGLAGPMTGSLRGR